MCSGSENYNQNRKCLTDVLTAQILFYDFLFSFMLTGCGGCIESLYRAGEEKPIERYKTRVKVAEENKLFSSFQKYIIEFLGLNEQTQKFGLGSFDLKFTA